MMNYRDNIRLNYGAHALIITRDGYHPETYEVRVWWNAAGGNTSQNPHFEDEQVGKFDSYTDAVIAGEALLV
jgi:hypothetical protein